MIHEEYFPQCCYEANEVPQVSMILNKEMLLNLANDSTLSLYDRVSVID